MTKQYDIDKEYYDNLYFLGIAIMLKHNYKDYQERRWADIMEEHYRKLLDESNDCV